MFTAVRYFSLTAVFYYGNQNHCGLLFRNNEFPVFFVFKEFIGTGLCEVKLLLSSIEMSNTTFQMIILKADNCQPLNLRSILTSSSNWLLMKETHSVIARRRSEAVAI
jgi:hypothetical protein